MRERIENAVLFLFMIALILTAIYGSRLDRRQLDDWMLRGYSLPR